MLRLESKPAAKIRGRLSSHRPTRMRQANRDMVLCITFASFLSPGSVSITTKSIGDSDDRPICSGIEYESTHNININKNVKSNVSIRITSLLYSIYGTRHRIQYNNWFTMVVSVFGHEIHDNNIENMHCIQSYPYNAHTRYF